MIDYSYYTGRDLVYPKCPSKPIMPISDNPDVLRNYADRLEAYQKEKVNYYDALQEYKEILADRHEELQNKLISDYNLNREQFNHIWNKAYDDYHSGGLNEVLQEFDNLCEFIMEFKKY